MYWDANNMQKKLHTKEGTVLYVTKDDDPTDNNER